MEISGNIDVDWTEADTIFTTSPITVGLNFDKKDIIHSSYVYMGASRRTVLGCFQNISKS